MVVFFFFPGGKKLENRSSALATALNCYLSISVSAAALWGWDSGLGRGELCSFLGINRQEFGSFDIRVV